jgi:hypothetical protein
MTVTKIIRVLVNKTTAQKWAIELEVNLRQSLKPIEAFKTNKMIRVPS